MKSGNPDAIQLTLELDASSTERKDYIKQHWNITFARQPKISVLAKRIIAKVLAQLRDDEKSLRPYYRFHVTDVMPTDVENPYKEIKIAFHQLTSVKWMVEDLKRQRFVPRHLLDTTKIMDEDGFECGYDNGNITVVLNKALTPYFVQIAHYTTYEIQDYMTFRSWYSMRMFELLSAFRDTGVWEVSVSEFRTLMDCNKKYPQTADMIKRVLSEPTEELEPTKLAFTYETILDDRTNRGRKQIGFLRFKLKKVESKEIPKGWFDHSLEHRNVLLALLYDWKVKEQHITKYIKFIGKDKAQELMKDWEHRRRNKKIEDIEKYCNTVWCRVGKKAIEEASSKVGEKEKSSESK